MSRALRAVNVAATVLPAALVLVWPSWSAYEFSPRRLLHSPDALALFLAPWTCRVDICAFLSRIVQAGIVLRSPNLVVARSYALWFAIAGLRTLVGYILTRAVGWAYPPLFSHSALYERTSGLGPPLLALLVLAGVRGWPGLPAHRIEVVEPLVLGAICAALTWMDDAPWTYAAAIVLVVPIAIISKLLPAPTAEKTLAHTPPTRSRSIAKGVLACLVAIAVPQLVPAPLHPVAFPATPSPLLDVLILSYPRPNDRPEFSILGTTLASFVPLTKVPGVTVSVFTHTADHPSFARAQAYFTQAVFHTDTDTHADAAAGQHLHVAEALRWAAARPAPTEWVMLVEDDFPLCGGAHGRESLARVMQALERGRTAAYLERRGAFVGTGGSGLIFHRSLLPIVATLLRLHADVQSALPEGVFRRPADLIMQDCLLGVDPLCPRRAEVMQLHGNATAAGGNLLITSRMILDHIGADASTALGRRYGQDQWRCGWRHPFHGRDEVEVVVV
ncbi:hypothetical protein B0H15DRAFT_767427 [Mycena belliarum]|uniref:Glycosyltransferase n=1 Tax=Mycena belliarum TaxID=1033014 RepID=A0AAD6XTY3_9AGAR|nr:hypothetical protein B0H15DRAFT_767427 [Mycena belliae]